MTDDVGQVFNLSNKSLFGQVENLSYARGPMNKADVFPRRSLLTGLSTVAAGVAVVREAVGDESNPATQVADRSSSIRITAMKTYWVGPVEVGVSPTRGDRQ